MTLSTAARAYDGSLPDTTERCDAALVVTDMANLESAQTDLERAIDASHSRAMAVARQTPLSGQLPVSFVEFPLISGIGSS
jgi:hypothetical protein